MDGLKSEERNKRTYHAHIVRSVEAVCECSKRRK